jgi:endonuclease-3
MARTYVGEAKRRVPPAKQRIGPILEALEREHGDARIALNFSSDLELVICVLLSAQTTDVNVNAVTEKLFVKYRDPRDYLAVPIEELERDIFKTGFFRSKARNLRGAVQTVLEKYGGEVPRDIEELITIPGVGRKTANVVAAELGNAQGIVVDTHVRRLSQRLGFTRQDDPKKIEQDLVRLVPREAWARFPHLMIWHGRRICIARAPQCQRCPLNGLCPSARVPPVAFDNHGATTDNHTP